VRDTQSGKTREPVIPFNTMIRAQWREDIHSLSFTDPSVGQRVGLSPFRADGFQFLRADRAAGRLTIRHLVAPGAEILTAIQRRWRQTISTVYYSGIAGVGGAAGDRVSL
jgi:hypothetical protein